MGTFFGSDGSFGTGIGNGMFGTNGDGNPWNSFSPSSMSSFGTTLGTNGSSIISHVGNTYYASGTMYTRVGNMIVGSNGKTFSGIGLTDTDIMNIIGNDSAFRWT